MIPPATVMPHDPATSLFLDGWISEYSAQGKEGEVWRIFQDERYARTDAGAWQLDGMHCLGVGQILTVFDVAGALLYSGELRLRRMHW